MELGLGWAGRQLQPEPQERSKDERAGCADAPCLGGSVGRAPGAGVHLGTAGHWPSEREPWDVSSPGKRSCGPPGSKDTTGVNWESPWSILSPSRAPGPIHSSLECKLINVRFT